MNARTIITSRTVNCPECGGSGMRMGCTREIECFDCGGQGSWEESAADWLLRAGPIAKQLNEQSQGGK